MSALGDRLRRAATSVGQVLGGRRPEVELARVDQSELPAPRPLLALPAPKHPPRRQRPGDRPAAELHPCPFCGKRHQPVPLGGSGLADAYSGVLLAEPGQSRPTPIGRDAGHTAALVRDSFSP
jgi:hypothetical protein